MLANGRRPHAVTGHAMYPQNSTLSGPAAQCPWPPIPSLLGHGGLPKAWAKFIGADPCDIIFLQESYDVLDLNDPVILSSYFAALPEPLRQLPHNYVSPVTH